MIISLVLSVSCHGTKSLGRFNPTSDQANDCSAIREFGDVGVAVRGHTVLGEERVEEWAQHTSLWDLNVYSC